MDDGSIGWLNERWIYFLSLLRILEWLTNGLNDKIID